MTPANVLTVCEQRGVQLSGVGTELRARGRKGAVSDALKRGITEHKADLIELILARLGESPGQPVDIEVEPTTEDSSSSNSNAKFKIGDMVYPTTEGGVRLHNEPSRIVEARRTAAGTWQYRMDGFTQWRAEHLYALATPTPQRKEKRIDQNIRL
jgi:hypothetical protein